MDYLKDYDFAANSHLFNVKNQKFIFDVNSGAVHALDGLAFNFIETLCANKGDWEKTVRELSEKFSEQELNDVIEEVQNNISEGSLFSPENDLNNFNYEEAVPKALCLNVAHSCNMRCAYCFAGQGTFGEKEGLMSESVALKAIDFLIDASGERKNLEVDFFGGEPLLNFDVVASTVKYARSQSLSRGKSISMTLTTNALLLNARERQFIIDEDLGIIMSLDGRPKTNDRMRRLPGGDGTFDLVVDNIHEMMAMNPTSYYVRGTYTALNPDFTNDFKHLVGLGFRNISLEPIVGGPAGLALREELMPYIMDEYEDLAETLFILERTGYPINFFHFNLDINGGPCISKRLTGCGAGVEYLAVTPSGDIYPCHQFIGKSEFLMGNVQAGQLDRSIIKRFSRNTVLDKECRHCWARFYCGGGCHANALNANGQLSSPDKLACNMQQKRLECSFYLAARKTGVI
ncbi:MAG: thioether cross-link-forming SCIFF peptide maturase [Chitinophagales bacterium]